MVLKHDLNAPKFDSCNDAAMPVDAINYLGKKGIKPSKSWLSVWGKEHATAFTAAQMTQSDMLIATHQALVKSQIEGGTMAAFTKELSPRLIKMGWKPSTGVDSIPWRLERIFAVNTRIAYATGQWARIQKTKHLLPYLLYQLGPSVVHREQHVLWRGTLLPADHPWWRTHFPPRGYGCKCHIRQVGTNEYNELVQNPNYKTTAPIAKTREWINPRTGEIEHIPVGVDPGLAAWHPGDGRNLSTQRVFSSHIQKILGDFCPTTGGAVCSIPAPQRTRLAEKEMRTNISSVLFCHFVSQDAEKPLSTLKGGLLAGHVVAILSPPSAQELGTSNRKVILTKTMARTLRLKPLDYLKLQTIVTKGKSKELSKGRVSWTFKKQSAVLLLSDDDKQTPLLLELKLND